MNLWQQVDWKYSLEKASLNAFSRIFRVKLSKLNELDDIAAALSRSRFWISFDPNSSVVSAVNKLVGHLGEEYGLEVVMKDGDLYKTAGERSWELPTDPKQGARVMAALKQAEPMLEMRPFVKNGSSDTLCWAVFSSSDWAELEAADLYATRALFPLKGAVPNAPARPKADAARRQRTSEHEELLVFVSANKEDLVSRLVDALEKLETSHPDSAEERDAMSQIYRVQRRARR
jgi:hypothetical protein